MMNQARELMKRILVRYWNSLSFPGIILAAVVFAASMTPSLLPRSFAIQGLLSGFAAAFGYAMGVLWDWTWRFLQFRPLTERTLRIARTSALFCAGSLMACVLWRATYWQDSIRSLMQMPPVEWSYPYSTGGLAVVVAIVLISIGRTLIFCCALVAKKLTRFVPQRLAWILAVGFVFVASLIISNDLVVRSLLKVADASFARIDHLTEEGVSRPTESHQSGSDQSLIAWDSIGRRGKRFVVSGPTLAQLNQFHGKQCLQPLRVYVGLTPDLPMRDRARLALEELKRTNAFDRSVLIVATPTGTGWIDPGAVDTVEYLHAGDTAIVALQYSYLPSWLTIIVDPERPRMAARLLFEEVYGYWKTLPKDARPKLYLHGLSLGALGSETSADLFAIFEDPIDGAVWSGPPFPSSRWSSLTKARNEGTPFWRPEFRDGRMVRFLGQSDGQPDNRKWGPIRNVYLQYASDPMVFFSPDLAFSEPDWLQGKRGPDVSPYLRWVPVVTSLQIAFDLPLATNVPMGHGHNYAPNDYINAWMMVTEPQGISQAKRKQLDAIFADRQPPSF